MRAEDRRYRLVSHGVVAEVIDGEAIIMHLGQGAYYSIAGAGAAAWSLLLAGATPAEAAHAIGAVTGVPGATVTADINALLARVIEEGLLTLDADAVAPSAFIVDPGLLYTAPLLNKYADMKEMLALDPPIPQFGG